MRNKFIVALILLVAIPTQSMAATAKPTAKPSAKPSTKATAKPTAKSTAKSSTKPTSKRRVYRRPALRKHIAVTPSPSPIWPPVNFQKNKSGDSYAKILKNEELIGLASASPALTDALQPCSKFACAAVIVASENICTWWNITSSVTGINTADTSKRITLGSLRTFAKGTPKQSYETIILVSGENVADGVRVESINANCMTTAPTENIPGNIYTPVNNG